MERSRIPTWLCAVSDNLQKNVPDGDAFDQEFAAVVETVDEKDVENIWRLLLIWLLTNDNFGLKLFIWLPKHARRTVADVINDIAALHQRRFNGETVGEAEWISAASSFSGYTDWNCLGMSERCKEDPVFVVQLVNDLPKSTAGKDTMSKRYQAVAAKLLELLKEAQKTAAPKA